MPAKKGADGDAGGGTREAHSRKKAPVEENTTGPSWGSLEASKARLAAAMDRCEYLASSRNRFTEVAAAQTDQLRFNMIHRTKPSLHMNSVFSQSVPDMKKMLEDQRELQSSSRTAWKRLDSLSRFVVDKERSLHGQVGADAAQKSAKGATVASLMDGYGDPYAELIAARGSRGPARREWPLMAVECAMPYTPTEEVRLHGTRKLGNS